jgi:hypothetical protein
MPAGDSLHHAAHERMLGRIGQSTIMVGRGKCSETTLKGSRPQQAGVVREITCDDIRGRRHASAPLYEMRQIGCVSAAGAACTGGSEVFGDECVCGTFVHPGALTQLRVR